jgi:hypothetical protein
MNAGPLRPRLATALVLVGVAVVAVTTLWPLPDQEHATPPWCIVCDVDDVPNFLLNIVLFMPLGVGLRWRGLTSRAVLLLLASLSVGVECLQFQAVPGRDASLGDVVANLLGGWIGLRIARRWRPPPWSARG